MKKPQLDLDSLKIDLKNETAKKIERKSMLAKGSALPTKVNFFIPNDYQ